MTNEREPSLSRPTAYISVRVPPEFRALVEKMARDNGVTVGEVSRWLLQRGVRCKCGKKRE